MRSKVIVPPAPPNPCSPAVLAASTHFTLKAAGERAELPLFWSPSQGNQPRRSSRQSAGHRLTARDIEIVQLVHRYGAVRADQVQRVLFSPGAASRCQLRLTYLVQARYLDRLLRLRVNDPAIYVLTRRSTAGNWLLRARLGDAAIRRRPRLGPLDHLLAVNDVRASLERACRDLGWTLRTWQQPEELAPLLESERLIPDGYCQIERLVDGQTRTSAFFLEVERVAKSREVLRSKLERYGALYYSGGYQERFGLRALRLLVVIADPYPSAQRPRAVSGCAEADRLGVTFARFAALADMVAGSSVDAVTRPIWLAPGKTEKYSLFLIESPLTA